MTATPSIHLPLFPVRISSRREWQLREAEKVRRCELEREQARLKAVADREGFTALNALLKSMSENSGVSVSEAFDRMGGRP